jgi:hypothetical protein
MSQHRTPPSTVVVGHQRGGGVIGPWGTPATLAAATWPAAATPRSGTKVAGRANNSRVVASDADHSGVVAGDADHSGVVAGDADHRGVVAGDADHSGVVTVDADHSGVVTVDADHSGVVTVDADHSGAGDANHRGVGGRANGRWLPGPTDEQRLANMDFSSPTANCGQTLPVPRAGGRADGGSNSLSNELAQALRADGARSCLLGNEPAGFSNLIAASLLDRVEHPSAACRA